MRIIKIVMSVLVVILLYVAGLRTGRKQVQESIVEKVDTLVVVDTIMQYRAILEERIKVERVLVPVIDTLRLTDTLYVYMDREQVMWQDSLSRIYVSGIMPQVDSVEHYVSERVITRTEVVPTYVKKRWGLGVHAGYGVQLGNQVRMSPYIGVGISYNLLSW